MFGDFKPKVCTGPKYHAGWALLSPSQRENLAASLQELATGVDQLTGKFADWLFDPQNSSVDHAFDTGRGHKNMLNSAMELPISVNPALRGFNGDQAGAKAVLDLLMTSHVQYAEPVLSEITSLTTVLYATIPSVAGDCPPVL